MKRRELLLGLALAPWLTLAQAGSAPATATVFGRPPPRIKRVFAAGAPAGVLACVLAPDTLLGWPMPLSTEARGWLPPVARSLPFVGRLAGRGTTMPVETLLQLQPDLILDAGSLDATYVSTARKVAQQTGLPYVLTGGLLAQLPAQLRQIGRLLGRATRGETLATHAEQLLAQASRLRAALPASARPGVYFGRGADGLETGLDGSLNMEIIAAAGGRNVAAAAGQGGLARVSLEQVLAWNPDVILTQDPAFAARARRDPAWRALSAVRNGRVHCAPTLPFGWLDGPPGVNRLIGLPWLLALLHREPARVRALPATVSAFYRLFYGIKLTATQRDRLLGEEG